MNNQNKIQDKSLRSGERAVKNNLKDFTSYQLYRYIAPFKYISNKDVVGDLGCGVGHGSFLLAKKAKRVFGIDDSPDAIHYASKFWKSDNIVYCCKNVMELSYKFDVVVIHEVIEHVKDVEKLFKVLARVTKKYLIFTVPGLKQKQTNHFHWKHYSFEEIKELLESVKFEIIQYDGDNCPFYVAKRKS